MQAHPVPRDSLDRSRGTRPVCDPISGKIDGFYSPDGRSILVRLDDQGGFCPETGWREQSPDPPAGGVGPALEGSPGSQS